jgi:5'-phosphate synthase pdxT subunit
MKIGVLALQGDFREHIDILGRLKVDTVEVRKKEDLKNLAGLIIPGGESTTIMKLMKKYGLDREIKNGHKQGMAIYGSCAGAITLTKEIENYPKQPSLALADITISRNSYGRQIDSFEEKIAIKGEKKQFPAIFIRAPIIRKTGKKAEILARQKNNPVLIRQDNLLISTFHPELTDDNRIHAFFLKLCPKVY